MLLTKFVAINIIKTPKSQAGRRIFLFFFKLFLQINEIKNWIATFI